LLQHWGAEGPKLLAKGPTPNAYHAKQQFEEAVSRGNSEIVQHFLLTRPDIDKSYLEHRLEDAIVSSHSLIVQLLLTAHPNAKRDTKALASFVLPIPICMI
jgi:hypothetical protein